MSVEPVYLVCDKCEKPTPSGIAGDPATMADKSNAFSNNRSRCTHCGNIILWSKAELWPESVIRERFPGYLPPANT